MTTPPPALDPFDHLWQDARGLADALVDPGLDADEREALALLLPSLDAWARREVDSAAIDAASHIPPRVRQGAASLGLYGLTIPSDFGGAGLSLPAVCRVIDALAAHDSSLAVSVGLHNGLGLQALLRHGSPELQARYLPDLAAGRKVAAFAATEPGAGSHIAGATTTATWDGDRTLTLSGEKCFVTNGGFADVFTVLARTPGLGGARRGASLLLLDRATPGLTTGPDEHKLGIRGSSTTSLYLDGVTVDTSRVIGPPGRGLDLMNEVLAWGRTLLSAGCVGTARAAYRRAVRHILDRSQFGRPLARFGLVRQKVAELDTLLFAAESLVRLTALLQARHGSDIIWASSVTKVFASETVWRITDDALQLHGGAGFIESTGASRSLRDCRITRIFEGANDVLRTHLATAALTFPPHPAPLSPAPLLTPSLAPFALRFEAAHSAIRSTRSDLLSVHGLRLTERQLLLAPLADALIALLTFQAVLLRTDGLLRHLPPASHPPLLARLTHSAHLLLDLQLTPSLALTRAPDLEPLTTTLSDLAYASPL